MYKFYTNFFLIFIISYLTLTSCQNNTDKQNFDISKVDLTTPKAYGRYLYELVKSNNKQDFKKLLIDTSYAYLFNDLRTPYLSKPFVIY